MRRRYRKLVRSCWRPADEVFEAQTPRMTALPGVQREEPAGGDVAEVPPAVPSCTAFHARRAAQDEPSSSRPPSRTPCCSSGRSRRSPTRAARSTRWLGHREATERDRVAGRPVAAPQVLASDDARNGAQRSTYGARSQGVGQVAGAAKDANGLRPEETAQAAGPASLPDTLSGAASVDRTAAFGRGASLRLMRWGAIGPRHARQALRACRGHGTPRQSRSTRLILDQGRHAHRPGGRAVRPPLRPARTCGKRWVRPWNSTGPWT